MRFGRGVQVQWTIVELHPRARNRLPSESWYAVLQDFPRLSNGLLIHAPFLITP